MCIFLLSLFTSSASSSHLGPGAEGSTSGGERRKLEDSLQRGAKSGQLWKSVCVCVCRGPGYRERKEEGRKEEEGCRERDAEDRRESGRNEETGGVSKEAVGGRKVRTGSRKDQ